MEVSSGIDFIQCLGPDMSIKILMCLEDPSDLVRVSSVSTSWRHFGKAPVSSILVFVFEFFFGYALLLFGYLSVTRCKSNV